jgi:hypothetical protein
MRITLTGRRLALAVVLVLVLAVSLFAVAAQAFHASSSKLPKQADKQLGLAGPPTTTNAGFGNHSLQGLYEFQADGVVEVNGVPTPGFLGSGQIRSGRQGEDQQRGRVLDSAQ